MRHERRVTPKPKTTRDEHQPGGGQRRQARPEAQEAGEAQAERAEHLGHADEPHEQARQRYRASELLERQDQLNSTGPQKRSASSP